MVATLNNYKNENNGNDKCVKRFIVGNRNLNKKKTQLGARKNIYTKMVENSMLF